MFIRRLVLAVVVLLAFAQSGWAIIMNDGAQSDPTWQQAYQTLGDQYPSVVGLLGYNGTSWENIGSGVVISPNCVIGAAHTALANNGTTFQKYAMETGNNLVSDYWGLYYTTQVSVMPGYSEPITSSDLAIWTFSDTITSSKVKSAKLYTESDSALLGSFGDLSGFGDYGYPFDRCVHAGRPEAWV